MVSPVSLNELQRIKKWHVANKAGHRVEYELLDLVLTLWLMGWVGWIPSLVLHTVWALPLCVLAMGLPTAYVRMRTNAHNARQLRCDWLPP
jgi:Flp pilus assembly protein TadB